MPIPPVPAGGDAGRDPRADLLRSIIDELAAIPRLPTSPGERRAADLLRRRLTAMGLPARVEHEPAFASYAWPIGVMSAAAVAAGLAGRRHRSVGFVGGAVAAAGVIGDVTGSWMAGRSVVGRQRQTSNVIADVGDHDAEHTLCILVHHDAAPSGVVFDQTVQRWLAATRPDIIDRMRENPPLWWPVIAGPALISLGSLLGSPWLRRAGLVAAIGSVLAMIDIGSRPAVPGANDNLSGVAAAVVAAQALHDNPPAGLRVMLVSAGAEEALQEGITGFARRHFAHLPVERTWFLVLDTVGSGRLLLLEAEGPVWMHRYHDEFKDLVAACADAEGVTLIREHRSRNSTDGIVPSRQGYPTAVVVSVDENKLIPDYHLNSDVPENVDVDCVLAAARLTEAVARRLAARVMS
jgi:hypothetical protein